MKVAPLPQTAALVRAAEAVSFLCSEARARAPPSSAGRSCSTGWPGPAFELAPPPNSPLTGAESPALSSAPTLRPCDEREVGSVRVGPAWPSPREERESEDHKPESA